MQMDNKIKFFILFYATIDPLRGHPPCRREPWLRYHYLLLRTAYLKAVHSARPRSMRNGYGLIRAELRCPHVLRNQPTTSGFPVACPIKLSCTCKLKRFNLKNMIDEKHNMQNLPCYRYPRGRRRTPHAHYLHHVQQASL